MPSGRGEAAAARVAAAALRASELRERLARLRRGEPSTPEDVALARLSARNQKAEALRAQERLLQTFAAAAALHGPTSVGSPDTGSRERQGRPAATETPPALAGPPPRGAGGVDVGGLLALPADLAPVPAVEERLVLRQALVSIASSSNVNGGWSKDQRQQLWLEMADQCGQESWQGWSSALCRTAPSLLPALRGVAISGYDAQGAPHLLAVTDEWTRRAEEVVQLVGEGPAVDAYRGQVPVLVQDLTREQTRWPGYVDAAAKTGVTALGALPVQLHGVTLGLLTLYPGDHDRAEETSWADYFFLSTVAAKTLLVDLDAVEHGWPMGELANDAVQMATGMLAAQLDVGVDEASVRLRAFAFSHARGLGEVAEAVLDGTLLIA